MSLANNPRLLRFLLNIAFALEPLAPTAISYFLSRTLRDWERQGLIDDFRAHTTRLGKFHYKVEFSVDVNSKQAHYIVTHKLGKRIATLYRR